LGNPQNEIAVSCRSCGKYAEVHVKAAPDYWDKLQKDRINAKSLRELVVYQEAIDLKKKALSNTTDTLVYSHDFDLDAVIAVASLKAVEVSIQKGND
jgi:hypothetical protein